MELTGDVPARLLLLRERLAGEQLQVRVQAGSLDRERGLVRQDPQEADLRLRWLR